MKTFHLAALLTIISGILFTFSHSIIKQVNYLGPDIHPLEIAFFSNIFSALFYIPIVIKTKLGILRTKNMSKHISRAFFNSGALTCFYSALVLTELADVIALSLTGPIFVTLGALIFLGEVVKVKRWIAIICGGLGALIIIRPGFEELNLGLLFVLWMLFFDSNSYLNHNRLSNDINQLQKDKQHYKEEIKNDSIALEELSSPEGLEKYAREKYHMKKENEEIFLIIE